MDFKLVPIHQLPIEHFRILHDLINPKGSDSKLARLEAQRFILEEARRNRNFLDYLLSLAIHYLDEHQLNPTRLIRINHQLNTIITAANFRRFLNIESQTPLLQRIDQQSSDSSSSTPPLRISSAPTSPNIVISSRPPSPVQFSSEVTQDTNDENLFHFTFTSTHQIRFQLHVCPPHTDFSVKTSGKLVNSIHPTIQFDFPVFHHDGSVAAHVITQRIIRPGVSEVEHNPTLYAIIEPSQLQSPMKQQSTISTQTSSQSSSYRKRTCPTTKNFLPFQAPFVNPTSFPPSEFQVGNQQMLQQWNPFNSQLLNHWPQVPHQLPWPKRLLQTPVHSPAIMNTSEASINLQHFRELQDSSSTTTTSTQI